MELPINKKFTKGILFLFLFFCSAPTHASVVQYLFDFNYLNPASLTDTKKTDITIGALTLNTNVDFKGTDIGGIGTTSSSEVFSLPYFFGAVRINPCTVLGLNISQPLYGNIQFPDDSIARFSNTENITHDIDFNPAIGFKLSDKLSAGAGFVANYYHDSYINFVLPGLGNAVNKFHDWAYGWDIGLNYAINAKNYLALYYFSQLNFELRGTSAAGPLFNNNFLIRGFSAPATTIVKYVALPTKNWILVTTLFYSQWNTIRTITFENVAGVNTIPFRLNYSNSWAAKFYAEYKFNPKWSAFGIFLYDTAPTNYNNRTVAFPADNIAFFILGGNYQLSKEITLQASIGHGAYDTKIFHPLGSPTVGDMSIAGSSIDVRFIYKS
jgi:long-chain fatty acid transport protein